MGPPPHGEPIPGIDRVRTPWAYDGVGRDLILALKLRGVKPAAVPLAAVLAGSIQRDGTEATAITWVPGRTKDTRRRGFDHAASIALELSALIGLPARRLLARNGDRPDQTTLSAAARRQNLTGAFVASDVPARVVLVDDLVTTGTTAEVCARALRDCGASYVEVAAPCRA